eukprot:gnl/Chilomastix_cuspidata/2147.p1 GENE.gnl/Chilomastix_cuspidata/2147~~gnl/Chilomastix_cuspidata/2147.p1  ORF type:complete len:2222 (+),score=486.25 gnl/Chilomastix_cuspidata/2147:28-6693(+)
MQHNHPQTSPDAARPKTHGARTHVIRLFFPGNKYSECIDVEIPISSVSLHQAVLDTFCNDIQKLTFSSLAFFSAESPHKVIVGPHSLRDVYHTRSHVRFTKPRSPGPNAALLHVCAPKAPGASAARDKYFAAVFPSDQSLPVVAATQFAELVELYKALLLQLFSEEAPDLGAVRTAFCECLDIVFRHKASSLLFNVFSSFFSTSLAVVSLFAEAACRAAFGARWQPLSERILPAANTALLLSKFEALHAALETPGFAAVPQQVRRWTCHAAPAVGGSFLGRCCVTFYELLPECVRAHLRPFCGAEKVALMRGPIKFGSLIKLDPPVIDFLMAADSERVAALLPPRSVLATTRLWHAPRAPRLARPSDSVTATWRLAMTPSDWASSGSTAWKMHGSAAFEQCIDRFEQLWAAICGDGEALLREMCFAKAHFLSGAVMAAACPSHACLLVPDLSWLAGAADGVWKDSFSRFFSEMFKKMFSFGSTLLQTRDAGAVTRTRKLLCDLYRCLPALTRPCVPLAPLLSGRFCPHVFADILEVFQEKRILDRDEVHAFLENSLCEQLGGAAPCLAARGILDTLEGIACPAVHGFLRRADIAAPDVVPSYREFLANIEDTARAAEIIKTWKDAPETCWVTSDTCMCVGAAKCLKEVPKSFPELLSFFPFANPLAWLAKRRPERRGVRRYCSESPATADPLELQFQVDSHARAFLAAMAGAPEVLDQTSTYVLQRASVRLQRDLSLKGKCGLPVVYDNLSLSLVEETIQRLQDNAAHAACAALVLLLLAFPEGSFSLPSSESREQLNWTVFRALSARTIEAAFRISALFLSHRFLNWLLSMAVRMPKEARLRFLVRTIQFLNERLGRTAVLFASRDALTCVSQLISVSRRQRLRVVVFINPEELLRAAYSLDVILPCAEREQMIAQMKLCLSHLAQDTLAAANADAIPSGVQVHVTPGYKFTKCSLCASQRFDKTGSGTYFPALLQLFKHFSCLGEGAEEVMSHYMHRETHGRLKDIFNQDFGQMNEEVAFLYVALFAYFRKLFKHLGNMCDAQGAAIIDELRVRFIFLMDRNHSVFLAQIQKRRSSFVQELFKVFSLPVRARTPVLSAFAGFWEKHLRFKGAAAGNPFKTLYRCLAWAAELHKDPTVINDPQDLDLVLSDERLSFLHDDMFPTSRKIFEQLFVMGLLRPPPDAVATAASWEGVEGTDSADAAWLSLLDRYPPDRRSCITLLEMAGAWCEFRRTGSHEHFIKFAEFAGLLYQRLLAKANPSSLTKILTTLFLPFLHTDAAAPRGDQPGWDGLVTPEHLADLFEIISLWPRSRGWCSGPCTIPPRSLLPLGSMSIAATTQLFALVPPSNRGALSSAASYLPFASLRRFLEVSKAIAFAPPAPARPALTYCVSDAAALEQIYASEPFAYQLFPEGRRMEKMYREVRATNRLFLFSLLATQARILPDGTSIIRGAARALSEGVQMVSAAETTNFLLFACLYKREPLQLTASPGGVLCVVRRLQATQRATCQNPRGLNSGRYANPIELFRYIAESLPAAARADAFASLLSAADSAQGAGARLPLLLFVACAPHANVEAAAPRILNEFSVEEFSTIEHQLFKRLDAPGTEPAGPVAAAIAARAAALVERARHGERFTLFGELFADAFQRGAGAPPCASCLLAREALAAFLEQERTAAAPVLAARFPFVGKSHLAEDTPGRGFSFREYLATLVNRCVHATGNAHLLMRAAAACGAFPRVSDAAVDAYTRRYFSALVQEIPYISGLTFPARASPEREGADPLLNALGRAMACTSFDAVLLTECSTLERELGEPFGKLLTPRLLETLVRNPNSPTLLRFALDHVSAALDVFGRYDDVAELLAGASEPCRLLVLVLRMFPRALSTLAVVDMSVSSWAQSIFSLPAGAFDETILPSVAAVRALALALGGSTPPPTSRVERQVVRRVVQMASSARLRACYFEHRLGVDLTFLKTDRAALAAQARQLFGEISALAARGTVAHVAQGGVWARTPDGRMISLSADPEPFEAALTEHLDRFDWEHVATSRLDAASKFMDDVVRQLISFHIVMTQAFAPAQAVCGRCAGPAEAPCSPCEAPFAALDDEFYRKVERKFEVFHMRDKELRDFILAHTRDGALWFSGPPDTAEAMVPCINRLVLTLDECDSRIELDDTAPMSASIFLPLGGARPHAPDLARLACVVPPGRHEPSLGALFARALARLSRPCAPAARVELA